MAKQSAGILLYRWNDHEIEVFLVHPGGPFWKNKDLGTWSIPKGEFAADENPLSAAQREFQEETGQLLVAKHFIELKPVQLKSGKRICAWAAEGDIDARLVKSNTFPKEWPPKSGKIIDVPEVDRADWFDVKTATTKVNPAQTAFITQLLGLLTT